MLVHGISLLTAKQPVRRLETELPDIPAARVLGCSLHDSHTFGWSVQIFAALAVTTSALRFFVGVFGPALARVAKTATNRSKEPKRGP